MAQITTWDEIRVASLQKMFLITGSEVVNDDSTEAYLNSMPAAYNEAVRLLSTANRYIVKYFDVAVDGTQNTVTVDLSKAVDDLFQLKPNGIYFTYESDGRIARAFGEEYVGDSTMFLNGRTAGTYRIHYYAYPLKVTAQTKGTDDLQIDPDVASLIPLYIASQLYKDDDIAIATQYRNEFEVGRELLERERLGGSTGEFISLTGWC